MAHPAPVALLVLLVGLSAVAGCADPPQEPVAGLVQEDVPVVVVEEDSPLGAIQGVVVDEAIRPLDNVSVSLKNVGNTTTTGGVFVFEDLEPGAYFITASLDRFTQATTSVEVIAGQVARPRLQLERIAGLEPYHYTLQQTGFIQASPAAAGVILDAAVEGFLGDNPFCQNCIFTVETNGQDIRTFVLEGVWQTTAPPVTAADLFINIINENFTFEKPGYGESATSPYLRHIEPSDPTFNDGLNSTWWRFQVGGSLTQPNVNQRFDLFVTVFVNAPAPEGWTLAAGPA